MKNVNGTTLKNNKGFTLTEVLISTAIMSISFYMLAGAFTNIQSALQRTDYNASLFAVKNAFTGMLTSDAAWERIMRNNGSTFNCWRIGVNTLPATSCATVAAGAPRAFNPVNADGVGFTSGGSVPYAPATFPNHGFTMNGEVCTTFSTTSPDARCPVRINFTWIPICPAVGGCIKPESRVDMNFQFSFPAGRAPANLSVGAFSGSIRFPGQSEPIRVTTATGFNCPAGQIVTAFNQTSGAITCAAGAAILYPLGNEASR